MPVPTPARFHSSGMGPGCFVFQIPLRDSNVPTSLQDCGKKVNYWTGNDQLACFTGAGSCRLEINQGSLNPQWEVII